MLGFEHFLQYNYNLYHMMTFFQQFLLCVYLIFSKIISLNFVNFFQTKVIIFIALLKLNFHQFILFILQL